MDAEGHRVARWRVHVPADGSGRQAGRSHERARTACETLEQHGRRRPASRILAVLQRVGRCHPHLERLPRGETPYPLKGGINESGSFMNMSNANAGLGGALEAGFLGGHQHVPSPRHRDGRHHPAVPALARDQQHPRVPGRLGRHRAHPALLSSRRRTRSSTTTSTVSFSKPSERHGSPNGTWTNIAGDAPGAYHHDDRLEDWFQTHNEVSDFSDHYPKAASGSIGRTSVEDFQENGWINAKEIEPDRWGTYRRFETGWMRMGKDACTGKLLGRPAIPRRASRSTTSVVPRRRPSSSFWPLLFENVLR